MIFCINSFSAHFGVNLYIFVKCPNSTIYVQKLLHRNVFVTKKTTFHNSQSQFSVAFNLMITLQYVCFIFMNALWIICTEIWSACVSWMWPNNYFFLYLVKYNNK